MKKLILFTLLSVLSLAGFSQNFGRLKIHSGLYDNFVINGPDTSVFGWRTDRFQLKYNTNKRFIDFIKGDSSTTIYNKLILESPNDTMLSVRGVSSLNGVVHINDTVYMSGNFINSEPAYLFTGYVDSSSFVWGKTSTARARWSFSIGDGSSSEGAFGFASGNSVNTGIYGFSINNSGNSGLKGFTSNVGQNNGESGTAVNNSENYGKWSFSANTGIVFAENASGFGLNTFNSAFSSFVIGAYNDTVGSHMYDGTSWVYSEPLFIIGNGIANHDNDAFRVLKNGKTFIGDSSDVTDAILVVDPTDSTSTFIGTVSVEKSLQVGNNTADTSLIVNGNLKADTIFGVTQMPYQSYVVRLTENLQWANSGPLVVGETYRIDALNTGDDFSNVGYMMPEMSFVATGTTPTNWSNGTYILNVTQSNPIVTVLYNSIGNVAWKYSGIKGSYRATFSENYDINKIAIFPAMTAFTPLHIINQGLTTWEGVGFFLNSYLIDASLNSYPADGVFTDYIIEVRIYP